MKVKLLLLFLLAESLCSAQQAWRPLNYNEFNRASCGQATPIGRKPIIVKNGHIFLFQKEFPDIGGSKSAFTVSRYDGSQWEQLRITDTSPIMDADGNVGNNEIPYIVFSDPVTGLPVVKKYDNGSWMDVGAGISSAPSPILNIAIGTDNLPYVLFREENSIKLKKFNGSDWLLISQSTDFIPYTSISFELDKNNVPYILSNYQIGSTYNCFVRKFNGSNWEEVGITGFTDKGGSLVFDNMNVPHISFNRYIKKFNGSNWVEITTPLADYLSANHRMSVDEILNLFFDDSNNLYVSFVGTPYRDSTNVFVRKLVNTTWQALATTNFYYDRIFTVSGNDLYHLSYLTDYMPDVLKLVNGQLTSINESTPLQSWLNNGNNLSSSFTHDFSICNGIPTVAYLSSEKARVSVLVDNNWADLGDVSENKISKAVIRSGTDGNVYIAYNNKLSSTLSDTKITVKKITLTNWQPVGPVNFSQSAGEYFDFALSRNNEPYVLYMTGRVQKFDGTNWVYIGGSAYIGDVEARLALDVNNLPYIAFLDPSNSGHIAVKRLNGNIWEYVDQAGLADYTGAQTLPRILIDGLNNIYLGFVDTTGNIHIKKLNNGVWESVGTDFFNSGKTGQYEISVNHNNVLHLVYNELTDNFRSKASVKKFNGTDWEFVGQPNFSATSMISGRIGFLENNTPIVAYSSLRNTGYEIIGRFFGETNTLDNENPHIKNEKWVLTPNPVSNTFSIMGENQIQSLEIFDLTGKKVHTENAISTNIDVSFLSPGIYLVKIKSDIDISTVKLIKN